MEHQKNKQFMIDIHDIKKVLSIHFGAERNKPCSTNKEKNMEVMRILGDRLTVIEMNVKDDLKKLNKGVHIDTIHPPKTDEQK